jgi:hypothetical protein
LPHSEILGSKPVCGSPKLFAAYHVLHRLLAPRHSPYALSSLTIFELGTNADSPSSQRPAPGRPSEAGVEAERWKLEAIPDSSLHCCCGRKKLPFAGYSVVKSRTCRAGAAGLPGRNSRFYDPRAAGRKRERRPFTVLRASRARPSPAAMRPRLVENTGLEPVTSWLQTRRSPS